MRREQGDEGWEGDENREMGAGREMRAGREMGVGREMRTVASQTAMSVRMTRLIPWRTGP